MIKYQEVSIEKIIITNLNPRNHFNAVKLKELADSIKEKGILQPLLLRPKYEDGSNYTDIYKLVCGERRLRAAKMASLTDVPAIIRELDDNQVLEIQIIENLQRDDLHPLEEAEGYEELIKKNVYSSIDELAAKIGKSKSYIYQRMKLCSLISKTREMFYDGTLTPSTALLIARIPEEMQLEAAEKITDDKRLGGAMTYIQAKRYIQDNYMLQLKAAPFNIKDKNLLPEAGKCADCPKRTGNQVDLFADITDSKDICTDPICFKKKEAAQLAKDKAAQKKDKAEEDLPDEQDKIINDITDDPDTETKDNPAKEKPIVDDKKQKEKDRQYEEVSKIAAQRAFDEVLIAFKHNTLDIWPFLMRRLLLGFGSSGLEKICQRYDISYKGIDSCKELIKKIGPQNYATFCMELLMLNVVGNVWDKFGGYQPDLAAACKLYNISIKNIEKEVKADLKAQEKEKKASEVKKLKSKTVEANSEPKPKKKRGAMEFKGADGSKVVVSTKTKLSKEDKKAAEEGLAKIAGMFGGKKEDK